MSTQIRKERTVEGPSSTVKTTTYHATTTYSEDDGPTVVKRIMQPRATIVHRSSMAPAGSVQQSSRQVSYGMNMGAPAGAYQAMTQTGVGNIKQSRDKEKKDMQDLNERFAGYIEKVRFLEAQNRKLADELDKLKQKWGKETTAIKAMYQAELDEARKLLDDAEKEKARLEIRCASLEEQIEELRAK